MSEPKEITYCVETLHHFLCQTCKKWWSISDTDIKEDILMFCPHCGNKSVPRKDNHE